MNAKTLFSLCALLLCANTRASTPDQIRLVEIPAGWFWMGSNGAGPDYDEAPLHRVRISQPFRMSATEITNAQYERFDPAHRALRGRQGFSTGDNEAVVFVSWHDAVAFCHWLSRQEGRNYRLPTEAEWEYACRAGSYMHYSSGDRLPEKSLKNQTEHHAFRPVDLTVGQGRPNAFGLYDMHGNVEEWCRDWYGPYIGGEQTDPAGYADGWYRVTRGGSHSTTAEHLRSANRLAMIPEDRHFLTGFRIVEAPLPDTPPLPFEAPAFEVAQEPTRWTPERKPLFLEPLVYVRPPAASVPPLYPHNHCPAVTWCANGDLLAVWFSTITEFGREMAIWHSRLRSGAAEWDEAALFCKVPDRNMTGSSLWTDPDTGRLLFLNGVEAAGWWRNLALMMQSSDDNGATWSRPRIAAPDHAPGHQVIAGMIRTREGWLLNACDAGPDNNEGSVVQISRDGGLSWTSPCGERPAEFRAGATGGTIAGIHACVVQLLDGSLLAFGRGNDLPDSEGRRRMPRSISRDMGRTWSYSASPFPPVSGGQRCTMIRLREGPILLVSFTHHPLRPPKEDERMRIGSQIVSGIFAAVSYDEGETWPVVKLLTDGEYRFMDGGAWTGFFETDARRAEPRGYLAMTQTPDGMIHLLSSRNHYRFNLPWLEKTDPEP
ncbi:SUMF1/EgtB/PvdO family nonheme iron enzyme [Alistipes sp.]|uniref:SUMF1/EgtB/PvdO family nonheme iron enzyme n=1 Tax=Alistipes sp. TaxID=1872444 RepID=UPI003AEF8781